jgi:hypothetical protein
MSSMIGLKEIVSFLLAGLEFYFFPLLILQLGAGLLVLLSSRAGIPMDSLVPILRAQIFLRQQFRLLLTLWVILFFSYGVLSVRGISSAGANLGDSGLLWRSTELSPSLVSCLGSSRLLV